MPIWSVCLLVIFLLGGFWALFIRLSAGEDGTISAVLIGWLTFVLMLGVMAVKGIICVVWH